MFASSPSIFLNKMDQLSKLKSKVLIFLHCNTILKTCVSLYVQTRLYKRKINKQK